MSKTSGNGLKLGLILKFQPHKMVRHIQTIRWLQLTNYFRDFGATNCYIVIVIGFFGGKTVQNEYFQVYEKSLGFSDF